MSVLAYTPFLDPLNLHAVWYLLLPPLALGIAVVYKAVRVGDLRRYPVQVAVFTVQIVGGIVLLGLAFYLLVNVALPLLAPMPGAS